MQSSTDKPIRSTDNENRNNDPPKSDINDTMVEFGPAMAKSFAFREKEVAGFEIDERDFICLSQAYNLFLKDTVGGLHTIYTRLRRLNINPIICNVDQVRALRNLGAIQSGVNRCKLITTNDFDALFDDCIKFRARPGRPPKHKLSDSSRHSIESTSYKRVCRENDNERCLANGEQPRRALSTFEAFQNVAAKQSNQHGVAEAELITTQQQLLFIHSIISAAMTKEEIEFRQYICCNQRYQLCAEHDHQQQSNNASLEHSSNSDENGRMLKSPNYLRTCDAFTSEKRNLSGGSNSSAGLIDVENLSESNAAGSANDSDNENEKVIFQLSSSSNDSSPDGNSLKSSRPSSRNKQKDAKTRDRIPSVHFLKNVSRQSSRQSLHKPTMKNCKDCCRRSFVNTTSGSHVDFGSNNITYEKESDGGNSSGFESMPGRRSDDRFSSHDSLWKRNGITNRPASDLLLADLIAKLNGTIDTVGQLFVDQIAQFKDITQKIYDELQRWESNRFTSTNEP